MTDVPEIDRLIDVIYDAAVEPRVWSSLSPAFANAFHSDSLGLVIYDGPPTDVIASTTTDEKPVRNYMTHYWKHDVVSQRLLASGDTLIVIDREILPPEQLRRSEFYNEFLSDLHLSHGLHATPFVQEGKVALLGLHRGKSAGPFDEADARLMDRLMPHLRRSLAVRDRLQAKSLETLAKTNALERSGDAIMVVNGEARLKYANCAGEALLARGLLKCVNRVVQTHELKGTSRLHSAVRRAANETRVAAQGLSFEDGSCELDVTVLPLRPAFAGSFASEPLALLIVASKRRRSVDGGLLREKYSLSRAEAELLERLLKGQTLAQYAAARNIKPTTAKTQLSSLFGKLGERRQSDVIRKVLNDLGRMDGG